MTKNNEENDKYARGLNHSITLSMNLRKILADYLEANQDELDGKIVGDICMEVVSCALSGLIAAATAIFFKEDKNGKYIKQYIGTMHNVSVNMAIDMVNNFFNDDDKNDTIN